MGVFGVAIMNSVTRFAFVAFAALTLPTQAQRSEIYKCENPDGGRPLYTSDKRDTVGFKCEVVSRTAKPSGDRSPSASTSSADIDPPIFTQGVLYHAQQQKSGKSPDTCSAVLRSFNGFAWP